MNPRACLIAALGIVSVGSIAQASVAGEATGKTRVYYIAADDTQWNYAPAGDVVPELSCCGDPDVWLKRGPNKEPPIFRKAVYHEYTDAGFRTRKPRAADWDHLGILGPLIRAEVGDTIEVVFKNNTLVPLSIHPHGVFYEKASEGSRYADGIADGEKAGDSVAPGRTFTYHWEVPERAGPGPADPSSVAWLYHSHVDSMRDVNAGLVGVILVTRRGSAKPDGSPVDVDHEFVAFFNIFDEALSHYSILNTQLFTPGTAAMLMGDRDEQKSAAPVAPGASMFAGTPESNMFFAINGYVFGNMPMPRAKVGERVRWYLVSLGNESGLHTPHWHGNVVLESGHRTDVIELLPASMKVADMIPDDPGIWLFHCHVEDHMMAGMTARYEITR